MVQKTTFYHNNLKILRPKVTKNITNLHNNFCEFPHSHIFLRNQTPGNELVTFNDGTLWFQSREK